eukprot:1628598-Prymnesium_polylepis.1
MVETKHSTDFAIGRRPKLARVQRTPFPANVKGMASEALWGAAAGKRSEGCSRELSEAKIAWRPNSMETDGLHAISNSPLVRAAHPLRLSQARRCRAGGRRRA